MAGRYSHLFVPASKADAYFRKLDQDLLGATLPRAVVFDLEDSIDGAFKDSARKQLGNTIDANFSSYGKAFLWYIRVNSRDTPWFADDLALMRELSEYRIALRLPKCRGPEDIEAVADHHHPEEPVIPAVETLQGYAKRDQICAYCSEMRMTTVSFGAGDLSMELGVERDYSLPVLQHLYSELLISTRTHGLNLFDAPSRVLPSSDPSWKKNLAAECLLSAENGFVGKGAVHPGQVSVIESVFSSDSKIAWARKLISEFEEDPVTRAVRSSAGDTYAGTPTLKYAKWILENRG